MDIVIVAHFVMVATGVLINVMDILALNKVIVLMDVCLVQLDAYLDVIVVIAVVMIVMMYLACAIGLLVVTEAAELEMVNNAQALLNYLNSIVNCKFGNLYIYCN